MFHFAIRDSGHVPSGFRRSLPIALGLGAAVWMFSGLPAVGQPPAGQKSVTKRVDDATIRNAGKTGEEWLSYGLTQGETRYSPLKKIDTTNVSKLEMVWSYDVVGGGGGTQESTPLVHDGVLYSVTNWSKVFALDARTGKEKWRFDPEVNQETVRPKICCGIVSRGLALYDNTVITATLDGRLIALDMETGKPVWEARHVWAQDSYTITMAPRIAKGKVIIGAGGAEYPVRGIVAAYDAKTGKEAWKFYTVPGDPAKGFENDAMKKAAATWGNDNWKLGGGGTVWEATSYDPDEELVYVGTGNAGPWPENLRKTAGKDVLYACSIIAINVNTGQMKWYFQNTPGDSWDYDSVAQLLLADLNIRGRTRKVIMQANKNGFYYVLDRVTGEFISGRPFTKVTWAKGLDDKGRPQINKEALYTTNESIQLTPGPNGGHNWAPMAFNPTTGLVYIPTSSGTTFNYQVDPVFDYKPGAQNLGINLNTTGQPPAVGGAGKGKGGPPPATTGNTGESSDVTNARAAAAANPTAAAAKQIPAAIRRPPPPSIGPDVPNGNYILAWDPVNQTEKWRHLGGTPTAGGMLSTAGNLVFQTIGDGRMLAFSADKGEVLLELRLPTTSAVGPPMTFLLDGKQYIAVQGGQGPGQPQGFGGGTVPNPKGPPPALPKLMVFAVK
ncbi:MAG: PQQ-dependent dehydrogenase, methanol/ethanol family [Acidobacteriota bacterium]